MQRRSRLSLAWRIGLATLAGMLVLALLPPVQLATVRWLSRDLDGGRLEIDSIWAAPWGLSVAGLTLETEGVTLELDAARANLAFWSSVTGARLDIESANLMGLDIRVTRQQAAGTAPAATAPLDGSTAVNPSLWLEGMPRLAEHLEWPRRLALRALELDATIIVEGEDGRRLDARATLIASGLAAGNDGQLALSGEMSAGRDGEVLAAVDVNAEVTTAIAQDARVAGLQIQASLDSTTADRGLDATASVSFAADGDAAEVTVDGRNGVRLVTLQATQTGNGGGSLDWEFELTPGVVAAFARGRSVADLSGRSTGTLELDPDNATLRIRSTGSVVGNGWEAFDPRLVDFGPLTLNLTADASLTAANLTAVAAEVSLSAAEIGELLRIEALQPLAFELDTWLVEPDVIGEPAIRISAYEMPIRWLGRFLPTGKFQDGRLDFSFDLIRDEGRDTRLVVNRPLVATQVTLNPVGTVTLPPFDLTLVPEVTLTDGVLDADIESLTIESETGLTVRFNGMGQTSRTTWPVAEFTGEISAMVPALERIVPRLDRVRATTSLSFDFDELVLAVTTASIGADGDDGRELAVADLSGQQPLLIPLPLFQPRWDAFEAQTGTLVLNRMPIDWLSPYIPELSFSGGELSGSLVATTSGTTGLSLRSTEPLVLEQLVPAFRGRPARQALTARLQAELSLGSTVSAIRIHELRLDTAGGDSLNGNLELQSTAGSGRIDIALSLDGNFPSLAARLGARVGAMRLAHRSSLATDTGRIDVDSIELQFADAGDAGFLDLVSLRPFYILPEPFAVGADGEPGNILQATVTPLRLEQLLPQLFGFDLEGVLPEGEFFGRIEPGGRLVLAADQPLEFRDVTVRWEDSVLLDQVTMSARYEIAYSAAGVEVRSLDLSARDSNGDVMLQTVSEVVAPLSAETTWSRLAVSLAANLPALRGQPVLADLPEFTSGRFSAALAASNADTTTLSLSAVLQNAATAIDGPVPDVDLAVEAEGVRGESVALSMPISMSSSEFGASDLKFDGTLIRSATGPDRFTAELSGAHVAVPDLVSIGRLVAGPARADAPPPADDPGTVTGDDVRSAVARLRSERHSIPIWTDSLAGSARLTIDRLTFRSFDVNGLTGAFELAPDRAAMTNLEATVIGAALRANTVIGFDGESAAPYSLTLDASVGDLELGRLFAAALPEAPPTTEGRFDLTATLTSSGLNPIDLGLSSLGEIRLHGSNGVFRGLADFAGTGATASRVIGVLTFSRELRAVARLLEGLGEIHFEDANIVLARERRDTLELDALTLSSPQIALEASGSLSLAPTQALLNSPLSLSTEIAARGDVAILFDGMELLEPPADDDSDEYRPLVRPIAITGTPAEPDASSFWTLLDEGAENARGSFGLSLRTLNRRLEARASEAPE